MRSQRFIQNGNLRLCLETSGQGPRQLLFVHGWISSRRIWWEVLEHLDLSRFTAHLLDLRGCGSSDRPREGHDLEGYASDVLAAIQAIGSSLTLVAHSAGGKIAQYIAATQAPSHLSSLVLVAPGTAGAYPVNPHHRRRTVETFGHRERISEFQKASMAQPLKADVMDRLVEDALICQYEAWMGWYDHGRSADFSDQIRNIQVPCLVVAGQKDLIAPERRIRSEVADKIRGARLVVLSDTGHNLPVERPSELAALIQAGAH